MTEVAEIVERFVKLAEKKTGLTKAQMLEQWREPRVTEKQIGYEEKARTRGVPPVHIGAIAFAESCEALRAVHMFLQSPQIFLVLMGGPRTHKSGSAAWAVSRASSGIFISARDYIALAGSRRDEDQDRLYYLKRSDIFVLDDLGVEYMANSGFVASEIDSLFQTRYDYRLKLIVTTNLDGKQLVERYGERVMDRVRRAGSFVGTGTEKL